MEQTEHKLFDLEEDLKNSEYICEKVKSQVYAQNLYAALCNNSFRKNEIVPILKEESWHCSWRYAGEIVADLRNEGDYLDWYISGKQRDRSKIANPTPYYVAEGEITDEIRKDLLKLNWIVVKDK